jgi:ATP-dependent helicase HepA
MIAPTRLHLDRFLPPTVIRVVVDHQGNPFRSALPSAVLIPGDPRRLVGQETFRRDLFPKMLAAAESLAVCASETPGGMARELAAAALDAEVVRLEDLATRNAQVSDHELDSLRSTRDESLAALAVPRLRLDALRLIWRT